MEPGQTQPPVQQEQQEAMCFATDLQRDAGKPTGSIRWAPWSLRPLLVLLFPSLSFSLCHIFSLIVNIISESFANGHLFHVARIRHKSSCPPLGLVTKWLIKKGFCLLSNKPLTIASKCLVFSLIAGPLGQPKTGIADRREGENEERGGQNYSALGKEWKRVRF